MQNKLEIRDKLFEAIEKGDLELIKSLDLGAYSTGEKKLYPLSYTLKAI